MRTMEFALDLIGLVALTHLPQT